MNSLCKKRFLFQRDQYSLLIATTIRLSRIKQYLLTLNSVVFFFCLYTQNHIETKTIHIHFQMSYEVWRAIHINNKILKLYGFRVKRQTNTVWVVLRRFSQLSIQYVSSLSVSSGHKLQKRAVYSASTACSICFTFF